MPAFSNFPQRKKVDLPAKQNVIRRQKENILHRAQQKQVAISEDIVKIGKIISILLEQEIQYPNSQSSRSILNEGQLQYFKQNFKDFQLGHFLVVMQNPDKAQQLDENQNVKCVNCKQMMNYFTQCFSMETNTDRRKRQIQQIAFCISFLGLSDNKTIDQANLISQVEAAFTSYMFIKKADYFQMQITVILSNFLQYDGITQLRYRNQSLFQSLQSLIENKKQNKFITANLFQNIKMTLKKDFNQWLNLKIYPIYKDSQIIILLTMFKKLGSFFSQFGSVFFGQIMNFINNQLEMLDGDQQNIESQKVLKKKFNTGNYITLKYDDFLKKNILTTSGSKPAQFCHLFRNMLIYKLTFNSKCVVRQFLSLSQKKIFLVVKCGENQINKALQKHGMLCQTQLGSIDLFSLQPVDQKLRPLRLNFFCREVFAMNKFKIGKKLIDNIQVCDEISIESTLQKTFRQILNYHEDDLRVQIMQRSLVMDKIYAIISNQLNISYVKGQSIQQQCQLSILQWQAYYIYQLLFISSFKLIHKYNKKRQKKKQNVLIKQNIGMIYRLMFKYCLNKANQICHQNASIMDKCLSSPLKIFSGNKNMLLTMWDRSGVDEFSPQVAFIQRKKLNHIWRKYQSNQLKERKKIKESDVLILINKSIQQFFSVQSAIKNKLIQSYFPSHNPYMLRGIQMFPYIQRLLGEQIIFKSDQQIELDQLIQRFQLTNEKQQIGSATIQQITQFNIWNPMNLPLKTIQYYLGTKIYILFQFIQELVRSIKPMLILSSILQIMLWAASSKYFTLEAQDLNNAINVITIVQSLSIVIWLTKFSSNWRIFQETMALKVFGNENYQTLNQRLQFRGQYVRNILNDKVNYRQNNKAFKIIRLLITASINFGFVIVTVFSIVMIFYLKKFMIKIQCCSQAIVSNVPTILISLSVVFFGKLYGAMAGSLTFFQNHKTTTQYQNSKILNNYLVQFVNNFNSLFIYSFFQNFFQGLQICSFSVSATVKVTDCSKLVADQVLSSFVVNLIMNVMQIAIPLLIFGINNFLYPSDPNIVMNFNEFEAVEHFFQQQEMLSSYQNDNQIDGTIDSYMKLMVDISYIAFFGLSLPFCFHLCFIGGLIYLHFLKIKILFMVRRPIPVKVSTIGFWNDIILIVNIAGLMINCFYIIFTRKAFGQQKIVMFLFILILMLTARFLSISNPQNSLIRNFIERHNQNIKYLLLGAQESQFKIQVQKYIKQQNAIEDLNKDNIKFQQFINQNNIHFDFSKKKTED